MKIILRSDPLAMECSTKYPAYHHEGDRMTKSIRYIVMHSTEGDTAQGAAAWFTNPASGGSANLVVDDHHCFRPLLDTVIPWGAPPLNTHGFHIEQAGYARWTRAQWLNHRKTIDRAAYKAALRCKWYRIPARILTVAELEQDFGSNVVGGVPQDHGPLHGGIVTHRVIDQAYRQSDHTDPGPNWPADVFLSLLHGHLAKL